VVNVCLLGSAFGFDTFEHFYVGQVAYQQACKEVANGACANFDISKLLDNDDKSSEPWCQDKPGVAGKVGNVVHLLASPFSPSWWEVSSSDPEYDRAESALDPTKNGIPLGFGDLSALGGDFTSGDCDLFATIKKMKDLDTGEGTALVEATRRHFTNACYWAKKACPDGDAGKSCQDQSCNDLLTGKNGDKIPLPMPREAYVLSRAEAAAFERLPGYPSLALGNQMHFPMHSWSAYRDYHERAIRASKDRRFLRAMIEEGLAQHFLQDSFSAGHIGSAWGEFRWLPHPGPPWVRLIPIEYQPNRIVLQRSHDYLNEHGLSVSLPIAINDVDKKGLEEWTAYGDNSLLTRDADFQRRELIGASKISLEEVFQPLGNQHFQHDGTFPLPTDFKSSRLLTKGFDYSVS